MPIYEFHCEKCAKDSEVLVRSSRWRGTPCPHCGSKKMVKKLSVFASAGASDSAQAPACEGGSSSCGCCCGGRKHHH